MKKIWVFGDSFSHPFNTNIIPGGPMKDYGKWKGYDPKIYTEFIAQKINYELKTKAINACCNRTILSQFVSSIDKINDDDILIFNWTEINRHRIVHNKKFLDIVPFNGIEKVLSISKESIIEYCHNRIISFTFYSELIEYIKLIKLSKPNNLIINWTWCFFDEPENELVDFIEYMDFYGSLETISHETNGEIDDFHYSENAHKLLSEIFMEIIMSPDDRKKYRINTNDPVFRPIMQKNEKIKFI